MPNKIYVRHRNLLSVLLKDWARYRRGIAGQDASYLELCNRYERLEAGPDGQGYRCDWQWTSDLHAPKFLPGLGLRLMKRALKDHPIRRAVRPLGEAEQPEISFVIGHRGTQRLPHLLATLESIAAQQQVSIDCVVVEQDIQAQIAAQLPAWVRHVHTPPPTPDMPYCRSWAFNVGVKYCRADVLVLHDNDMLVPADYAANILKHVRRGYELVNLKRFIFYLNEPHTRSLFSGAAGLTDEAPLAIVQNLEAGGSVAITRRAYEQIGGMDEAFIGWGGEDNEFWERAQTLRVWPYAYLPIVHLWHAAQSEKHQTNRDTHLLYQELSAIPAETRIAQLRRLGTGAMFGPTGWKLQQ
jgi:hypothetical protein